MDGFGYWLIVDRSSGLPVGQARVMLTEVEGQTELAIGYTVERARWRQAVERAKGWGHEADG